MCDELKRRRELCKIETGKEPTQSTFFFWHRKKWLAFMEETGAVPLAGSHDEQFDKWLEKKVTGERE